VYQPGSSSFREINLDIKIQKRMYKQALGELIEAAEDELKPKSGPKPGYNKLFMVDGV
jgi:hypothetical protein